MRLPRTLTLIRAIQSFTCALHHSCCLQKVILEGRGARIVDHLKQQIVKYITRKFIDTAQECIHERTREQMVEVFVPQTTDNGGLMEFVLRDIS